MKKETGRLFFPVQLCGPYHGALNVLKCSRVLCPRFSVCFSILITSLGEENAGLCASRTLFVCFVRVLSVCPFSLPLGVEGWLRFMIVAYLDLSINFLFIMYIF